MITNKAWEKTNPELIVSLLKIGFLKLKIIKGQYTIIYFQ